MRKFLAVACIVIGNIGFVRSFIRLESSETQGCLAGLFVMVLGLAILSFVNLEENGHK